MGKPENRIVKNRPSPKNEDEYIRAYKNANPKSNIPDGKDVAAVITKSGKTGHALMKPSVNRSKDISFHRGKDFISDKELRKSMK